MKNKKITVKRNKLNIRSKAVSLCTQDLSTQEDLLECLELVDLTMLPRFEMVFNDLVNLLVIQTNFYLRRDKGNPNFSVFTKKMLNFIRVLFLSGYNV